MVPVFVIPQLVTNFAPMVSIYLLQMHKNNISGNCYYFFRQNTASHLHYNTGCPKINETHKIANKYVDFNPIVYIFQI